MTGTIPVQENDLYTRVIQINGKYFSDRTGRLLVTSSRGQKYTMIMYGHESKSILAEALKIK